MKKIILFFILISAIQIVHGQVEIRFFPQEDSFNQIKAIYQWTRWNLLPKELNHPESLFE